MQQCQQCDKRAYADQKNLGLENPKLSSPLLQALHFCRYRPLQLTLALNSPHLSTAPCTAKPSQHKDPKPNSPFVTRLASVFSLRSTAVVWVELHSRTLRTHACDSEGATGAEICISSFPEEVWWGMVGYVRICC